MENNNCFICKEDFNKFNSNHIKMCARKYNITLEKDVLRFKQICHKYSFDFNKEYIIEKYINEEWSLPEFEKNHQIDYMSTLFLINFYGLKARKIGECTKKVERFKKTCEKRYGVDNVSKLQEVKDKKADTFMENYGVDNIWKHEDYYEMRTPTMIEKYGKASVPNRFGNMNKYWNKFTKEEKSEKAIPMVDGYKKWWKNLSEEEKTFRIANRNHNFVIGTSRLETRIENILTNLNVFFKRQCWIDRRSYDFIIWKANKIDKVLLEVNGDFWHANPNIYNSSDILNHRELKSAESIWKNDKEKKRISRITWI